MTRPSGAPRPERRSTPSRPARRGLLLGALALGGLAVVGGARWYNLDAEVTADDLTAPRAYELAERGELLLVDIRRPDEWQATGIPAHALALDMRRPDFTEKLLARAEGRPVALICARGVRSARLTAQLRAAGVEAVHNVPEGMLGSGAGPGWQARGLPVTRP